MAAATSASGFPVHGTSVPSNLDVYEPFMGFPSAVTPSLESLIPSGVDSNLSVRRFGPGPGLDFDFATFSFQVPIQLSAARAMEPAKSLAENW